MASLERDRVPSPRPIAAKEVPLVFIALAIVDPQMHPPEELHAILELFDGEINVYEKGGEQFLRIKRMSNQPYLKEELPLKKQ